MRLSSCCAALVLLGQQQRTAVADRCLRDLGKALQQPWQHPLQAHMIVSDRAGRYANLADVPKGIMGEVVGALLGGDAVRRQRSSMVRSLALRRSALSLANICSIGLGSGEQGGR